MVKNDFIDKYPDVKEQVITTKVPYARAKIENLVNEVTQSLDTAAIFYVHSGKRITIFTSDRFKDLISQFKAGYTVTDPVSDKIGTITSEQPFYVCGEPCVKVRFEDYSDTMSCDYFIPEN